MDKLILDKICSDLSLRNEIKTQEGLTDYLMREIGLSNNQFKIDVNPFSRSVKADIFASDVLNFNIKISKDKQSVELKVKF